MLRIRVRKSAEGTKQYYANALTTSDYYTEKGEIIGQWRGLAAQKLGLSDEVTQNEFNKLCDNINPLNDKKLTSRNNSNRRVAYDLTFSAPKSVSIAFGITGNENILKAFQNSYLSTMKEIEADTETRVRMNGKNEERKTSNMVYSDYVHTTTRPVDGYPDPHLHAHCVVMNATFDKQESKWKAIELGNVKKNAPYYQALFHSSLAHELKEAGYPIQRTKSGFKLANVSQDLEKRFSRRTQEIELLAKEKGITSDKVKDSLGAKTRSKKNTNLSFSEIKDIWTKIAINETDSLKPSKHMNKQQEAISATEAIDKSLNHTLERKSAVERKELLSYAFELSPGTIAPDKIKKELDDRNLKSKTTKQGTFYTTQEAINEEKQLIKTTRDGKGKFAPINKKHKIHNDKMSKEQKAAVKKVLHSKDLVTIIAGGAGTGKTWSVKEIAFASRKGGKKLHAFAPSAAASRGVQVQEGFHDATTIAALLHSNKLQQQVKNGLIWVDEAGMVGNKTMNHILHIAQQQNARVLLTGDINQHNSVERGDALRIMQQKAGLKPAHINTIRRQQTQNYKQAIGFLSSDNIEKGFKLLDNFNAIKESGNQEKALSAASKEYADAVEKKKDTLLVATTHNQGQAVTEKIRKDLKEKNILQGKKHIFKTFESIGATEAQKKDIINYSPDQIISFHKPGKGGFVKGRNYSISEINNNQITVIDSNGSKMPLNLKETDRFNVFNQKDTELLKGDLIKMTNNSTSKDNKRLNKNDILTIKGFTKNGNIEALRGRTNVIIDKSMGHFTHGYYTTSPSSQGKSVEKVIVLQTAASGRAANKEQFYVSTSRGKFEISVHTDNKKALFNNIQRSSQRMTATDIAGSDLKNSIKEKIDAFKQLTRSRISKIKDNLYARNLTSIIPSPIQKPTKNVIRQ